MQQLEINLWQPQHNPPVPNSFQDLTIGTAPVGNGIFNLGKPAQGLKLIGKRVKVKANTEPWVYLVTAWDGTHYELQPEHGGGDDRFVQIGKEEDLEEI